MSTMRGADDWRHRDRVHARELAEAWASEADILIHPEVHEGHWIEFYSPDKFIKAGEEQAEEQLEEIKRLLVE